jgi:hypothetical protein
MRISGPLLKLNSSIGLARLAPPAGHCAHTRGILSVGLETLAREVLSLIGTLVGSRNGGGAADEHRLHYALLSITTRSSVRLEGRRSRMWGAPIFSHTHALTQHGGGFYPHTAVAIMRFAEDELSKR